MAGQLFPREICEVLGLKNGVLNDIVISTTQSVISSESIDLAQYGLLVQQVKAGSVRFDNLTPRTLWYFENTIKMNIPMLVFASSAKGTLPGFNLEDFPFTSCDKSNYLKIDCHLHNTITLVHLI